MKAKIPMGPISQAMSRAQQCRRMNNGVRVYLAQNFPETSQEIALLVLLRLSTQIAVDTCGKDNAPAALSRLINHFLIVDHTNKNESMVD